MRKSVPKGDKKKKREVSAEIAVLEQRLWEMQEEPSVTTAKVIIVIPSGHVTVNKSAELIP